MAKSSTPNIARTDRWWKRCAFVATIAAVAGLAACGGSDDGPLSTGPGNDADVTSPADATSPTLTSTGTGAAEDPDDDVDDGDVATPQAPGGVDLTHSAGTASLTIDGTMYRFGMVEGSISVCTNVFGSFQVALPLLDDNGAAVDGSEISVELIEPGSEADSAGQNTASFEAVVDGNVWIAGDSMMAGIVDVEAPAVDLVPDGSSASGPITLISAYEPETSVVAEFTADCE